MIEANNQSFIRDAIVELLNENYITHVAVSAGVEELEPEGDTKRYKPDGTFEILVKLKSGGVK